MTKNQLKTVVARDAFITRKIASEIIDTLFNEISKRLYNGEKVVVSGFGTFSTSKVGDKTVVPFGDESRRQVTKAHTTVNFKTATNLRKKIW